MSPEERRVYAADWFTRAAAMPCSLLLAAVVAGGPPGTTAGFLLSFLAILAGPAVIAGAWGAALGAAILDPAATRSVWRAALRGLAVSAASFVTYLFVLCLFLDGLHFGARGTVFQLFIVLLVYGSILVGWLVAAVGALAGALLYGKVEREHAAAGSEMQP